MEQVAAYSLVYIVDYNTIVIRFLHVGNESLSSLLEQLRIRIILKDEEGDTAVLANDSEPSIGELVVSNLERVKVYSRFLQFVFVVVKSNVWFVEHE